MADEEAILEIMDLDGADGKLEATERDGHFNLTIDNPWAGDTQSGFGYQTHISLAVDDARRLRDWLSVRLAVLDEKA